MLQQALWQRTLLRGIDALWDKECRAMAKDGFLPHWLNLPDASVPGIKTMRYLANTDRGTGPIWVFIHGFSSKAADWAPLLPLMTPACAQIVALDLPGHGKSPPLADETLKPQTLIDAAVEAVRQLVPRERGCVLVGNSMGGAVVVAMNHLLRDHIRATVLISPYGAPYEDDVHAGLLNAFTLNTWSDALQFAAKVFPNGNIPPPGKNATALALWAHLNRPQYVSLRNASALNPLLKREALQEMPPTLLIWGSVDYLMPRIGLEFFRSGLPAKTTAVITPSRFSHMPFFDQAPRLANEMLGWAEGHQLTTTVTAAPHTVRASHRVKSGASA